MSYTVKIYQTSKNIKFWVEFKSDRTLTVFTYSIIIEAFSLKQVLATVNQRLDFLCHLTPNWWVPFCVGGPVSTGEGKKS